MTTIQDEKSTTSTTPVKEPAPESGGGILGRINSAVSAAKLPDRRARRAHRQADRAIRQARQAHGVTRPRRGAVLVGSVILRLLSLFVIGLNVVVTVFAVIPLVGGWITSLVGPATLSQGLDAFLASWLLPYGFVLVLITVGELSMFRALWRAGSRRIASWKTGLEEARVEQAEPAAATQTTRNKSKSKGKK